MKIIQQDKKVIACIGKDDTNERKIIEMIENVQDDGITDFEVDAENPRLYSKDGLLYGKKKMMPNGKARLTLIAVPPDKKGTVEIAPGTEMIASDAFTDSKTRKVYEIMHRIWIGFCQTTKMQQARRFFPTTRVKLLFWMQAGLLSMPKTNILDFNTVRTVTRTPKQYVFCPAILQFC